MYTRDIYNTIYQRLTEPRKFIQVVLGPRQVGKTTVVRQVLNNIEIPYIFEQGDNNLSGNNLWISEIWEKTRQKMKISGAQEYIIVIDEIQKITNWSEAVKLEWDKDTFYNTNIKLLLLGSSRVLIEKGLSESLMGRYEQVRVSHWNFKEMKEAFGFSLNDYIYYGGYPGAASLTNDSERWNMYVNGSIIEATINKDILIDTPINKPALMRQTFELGCSYSSQILSYNKMLGLMTDAGNTTTLANYMNLLGDSGLLTGLQKYAFDKARQKSSSPKLQVFNNALYSHFSDYTLDKAFENRKIWGRFFESAIGAHIVSNAFVSGYNVFYWRENNAEVDFIIQNKSRIAAIEVKSNKEANNEGLDIMRQKYKIDRCIIIGDSGLAADEFLSINPKELL